MKSDDSMATLRALAADIKQAVSACADSMALQAIRVDALGKKGQLTAALKSLSTLSIEDKKTIGKFVNELKSEINLLIDKKSHQLAQEKMKARLQTERLDVTLPGRGDALGGLHPVTIVRQRLLDIFGRWGFSVVTGPEIEDDYHNFTALNLPENHPARAMQDTFYFPGGRLLRTQTSPVQIRTMKQHSPPIRIITPGRVYRCDSDQTHTPMFHQMEGLVIDRQANLAELKTVLQMALNEFWQQPVKCRFRPSYFPFTEPSMEVDIQVPEHPGRWLEVLGCGMVHPNVLTEVGVSPDEYQGYAFGLGLDRIAMLYFDIPDLRLLFEGDWRLLRQFDLTGVRQC